MRIPQFKLYVSEELFLFEWRKLDNTERMMAWFHLLDRFNDNDIHSIM